MQHRREIDGLRALAVLPVILFHAGLPGFAGGFVGVDVFFVISGYLITSIILAEQAAGTFTLAGFYERRARRLLPALFLVLLVSLPCAWFLLTPPELKAFAQSLIGVAVFASNVHFARSSGYFATEAESQPLLHTWSLAVEEQFYLLFPLLLLGLRRWSPGRTRALIGALAMASLGSALWGLHSSPDQVFYAMHARGGSCCWAHGSQPAPARSPQASARASPPRPAQRPGSSCWPSPSRASTRRRRCPACTPWCPRWVLRC
jgi:peptidoglycan/LPS O-acetylase OafA/YrhL